MLKQLLVRSLIAGTAGMIIGRYMGPGVNTLMVCAAVGFVIGLVPWPLKS